MPLVRLTGWSHSLNPSPPTGPLSELLIQKAGMDGSDAEAAMRRLLKGKSVDVSFDAGEDKDAKTFVKNAEKLGFKAKLYEDEQQSWSGSPPRPLFLKLALAVLVGFAICIVFAWVWPNALLLTAASIGEGLVILSWLFLPNILDKKPKTETQKEWEWNLGLRYKIGGYVVVGLIALIVVEPVYFVILLLVAICGIGCAFLIRMMNRD